MYVLELAGEDDPFAATEAAAAAATGVRVIAPGVALAESIEPARLRGLAFTRRASQVVAETTADVERARARLASADIDRSGTVAVRARDVRGTAGVDTRGVERILGDVLVDRGFDIDLDEPDHELRAVFADDVCVIGWLAIEAQRDYGERTPTEKPFFQPGSMDPHLARAVVNLAGAAPGVTILDPMCGTGGVLVEAGLLGARVIGVDAQARMVRGTRTNLCHFLDDPGAVIRGDAGRLPICSPVAAVVFDAPYGRQSRVEADSIETLVADALAASRRLADRAVVVCDRPLRAAATAAGWTVEGIHVRRVHRSLDRHVHVLTARGR